jgi:diguanylate cyclase (GGDEF)-like protein
MADLIEQLKRMSRLPSPPGAALQILKLAQEADVSLAQVGDTLAADPALSVRILKYANSALVGVSRQVTNVREAVVLLGVRAVRMMALSFSLVSTDDRRACPGFDYARFWAHSLAHAVAARHLAKTNLAISTPEEAFAAGLLASVGKLVFASAMPHDYAEVLNRAGGTLADTSGLERERFGMDYREAGGELLTEWGIPARLALAVRHQSDPDHPAVPPELHAVPQMVQQARPYADIIVSGTPDEQLKDAVVPGAQGPLPESLLLNMRREFQEIAAIVGLDRTSELDVTAIQAEAGEVLTELSLSAQLQREAVERENESLQTQAWTDGLTGIANRAAFEQRMEELWREAMQTRRPIAVALLDIDHFKKFNDTFGHRTGDAVLRAVASCLAPSLRSVDFAARYGGEEFVVIMPNADRLIGAGICVSIRRAIEQKMVEFEGKQHRVTVSVGSAVLPVPSPSYTPQMLIEAADQLLYRSKEKGRNCCSMRELPRTSDRAGLVAAR